MIAYLDSSVLLRLALKQPHSLKEFGTIVKGISSRLIRAECLRTLDRLFIAEQLSERDQTLATAFVLKAIDHLELISVDSVLDSVGNPMGLRLGTLDAIHLFSALKWREINAKALVFLTHDAELGFAAVRFGLSVLGV